jgi:hypothetical protein
MKLETREQSLEINALRTQLEEARELCSTLQRRLGHLDKALDKTSSQTAAYYGRFLDSMGAQLLALTTEMTQVSGMSVELGHLLTDWLHRVSG